MSDSGRPNRIASVVARFEGALPIVLIVMMAMGAGALAVLTIDFFSPYKYETTDQNYYNAECYRLELTKPVFPTLEYQNSAEGRNAQAEWNKNYPPYCDLAAQYIAANGNRLSSHYAAWTLILTFVGVVLLGLTLRATRDTLAQAAETTEQARLSTDASNAAVEATREIGQAQLRAWISVDLKVTEASFDGTIGLYTFETELTVKNLGNTPATNVHTNMKIFDWHEDHQGQMQALARGAKDEDGNLYGRTLAPTEQYIREWNFEIATYSVGYQFYPHIVGCVTYEITGDRDLHQTGFIFHLGETTTEGIPIGRDMPNQILAIVSAGGFYT